MDKNEAQPGSWSVEARETGSAEFEPPKSNTRDSANPTERNPFQEAESEPPRRRWLSWQFSLRSTLFLFLLAAIFMGWYRDRTHLAERVRELENSIADAGRASWSVEQVIGPPNTMVYGDIGTAWASSTQDGQREWLLMTYAKWMRPTSIHIHETYNPGAVYKVTAVDRRGNETLLWQGADPKRPNSGIGMSRIPVTKSILTRKIKIYLDSPKVKGWNEIDAVGMQDSSGGIQWAKSASASSSYGTGVFTGMGGGMIGGTPMGGGGSVTIPKAAPPANFPSWSNPFDGGAPTPPATPNGGFPKVQPDEPLGAACSNAYGAPRETNDGRVKRLTKIKD